MDKAILEQEATKLFGGATIDVKPYSDDVMTAWDITVVPYMDKGKRFIRIPTNAGLPPVMEYLKKIQQNLLKLNQSGALGIQPIQIPIDETKIGEEIAKRMPKENLKETYSCNDCGKFFKHPGPFAMHQKKHKKAPPSVASAPNDPLIYEAPKG